MKIYYAHPISTYNTPAESRDVATLTALGFDVVNPNHPAHEAEYAKRGMALFEEMAAACDALAFRALPCGSVPAGIAKEIVAASGKPVVELPSALSRRTLTVEATREFLRDSGAR